MKKLRIDDNTEAMHATILELIPQKPPFRYIDRIIEISPEKVVGQYRFKPDEWFYSGHFPGNPITPGVILVEAMAQTAVVALGIYLIKQDQLRDPTIDPSSFLTVFSDVGVRFLKPVLPGETVTVCGERIYWKRKILKMKAELFLSNGDLAVTGCLTGIGIKKDTTRDFVKGVKTELVEYPDPKHSFAMV